MVQTVVGLVATLSVSFGKTIDVVNTQPTQESYLIAQSRQLDPKEYLKEVAGSDFILLNKIIECESGWKSFAQNKKSSAGGLFQFIDITWEKYASTNWDKYNPYQNIKAGLDLYHKEGTKPWNASKSCWSH